MIKNLPLILTTSILTLTLVQHSAYAGAQHGFKTGGTAFTPVRNEHIAPKTAAASHRAKPEVPLSLNHRPVVQATTGAGPGLPQSVRTADSADLHAVPRVSLGGATDKPIVPPSAGIAASPHGIVAPADRQSGLQIRSDARALQPGDGPRNLRIPADPRPIIGPPNASPRISNPGVERSLDLEARALLRPNRNGEIEQSAMDRYLALNNAVGNATVVTPAIGRERFESMLSKLNSRIRTGEYRLAPLTGGNLPAGLAGNSRTIVIGQNENGKTVYVPASQLSGPDKRTIDVNCNECKVVVVGDRAKGGGSVEDDRRIVVNGNGDKVIARGDRANGAAGQDGGTVRDNRLITVNGNKDAVKSGGDSANGGDGLPRRNSLDGGDGGTVNNNGRVVVNGNKDKVGLGTNRVNGGDGDDGFGRGGNGGNGGDITDHRRVKDNGSNTSVRPGEDKANGGNGGDRF